jgi:imidazolonepropionase-like amidohydrolase
MHSKTSLCSVSLLAFSLITAFAVNAQAPELSSSVLNFVRVRASRVVLTHVRVIDGTGAPAVEDQNVIIENGKIISIGASANVSPAEGVSVLDLREYSIIPGIVGMHNHLYYIARPNLNADRTFEQPVLLPEMLFSAPRLYLAGGVTTMRTTGCIEPYADLNLKRDIDAGKLPGPHIDVTGPYLEGSQSRFIQMPHLNDPDEARGLVDYWADRGVTSFKAYMNITRAELKAAIDAAHKRGLKVTGHLCSVTYREAAELGIDNLEHGFYENTELDSGRKPDVCGPNTGRETLSRMNEDTPEAKELIAFLISHHVAVTSTLPVFESYLGGNRPPLRQQVLDAMSPQAREDFFLLRASRPSPAPDLQLDPALLWKHDLALERAFAAAGGLLLSGPDPTGAGHVLPGFGDQRGIELLVEAGFSPVEAIKIATLNGALYLGREKEIGSLAVGKRADLVVIKGNPSEKISDIENVEIVFKDGIGYDSQKLLHSVAGQYGRY